MTFFAPSELAEHRRDAESLMTLTLAAYSPEGWTNVGGVDHLAFTPAGATFGKVQGSKDTTTQAVNIGGVERQVMKAGLHIPITALMPTAGLQRGIGWEYVVTSIGPADDPNLLGRRYLVVGAPDKSFATARRLDVVDVTDQPV